MKFVIYCLSLNFFENFRKKNRRLMQKLKTIDPRHIDLTYLLQVEDFWLIYLFLKSFVLSVVFCNHYHYDYYHFTSLYLLLFYIILSYSLKRENLKLLFIYNFSLHITVAYVDKKREASHDCWLMLVHFLLLLTYQLLLFFPPSFNPMQPISRS